MPGVVTAGLVCTVLQFMYNELGIARIQYVSRKLQPPQPQPTPAVSQPVPLHQEEEPKLPLSERVFAALGWHKLPDGAYLDQLKLRREMYLRRIAELQKESEEEAEAKHQAEESHKS